MGWTRNAVILRSRSPFLDSPCTSEFNARTCSASRGVIGAARAFERHAFRFWDYHVAGAARGHWTRSCWLHGELVIERRTVQWFAELPDPRRDDGSSASTV